MPQIEPLHTRLLTDATAPTDPLAAIQVPLDPMPAPTNLTFSDHTAKWDAVPGAVQYKMGRITQDGSTVDYQGPNTSKTYSALADGTYDFYVSAQGSDGTWSANAVISGIVVGVPSVIVSDANYTVSTQADLDALKVSSGATITIKPGTYTLKKAFAFDGLKNTKLVATGVTLNMATATAITDNASTENCTVSGLTVVGGASNSFAKSIDGKNWLIDDCASDGLGDVFELHGARGFMLRNFTQKSISARHLIYMADRTQDVFIDGGSFVGSKGENLIRATDTPGYVPGDPNYMPAVTRLTIRNATIRTGYKAAINPRTFKTVLIDNCDIYDEPLAIGPTWWSDVEADDITISNCRFWNSQIVIGSGVSNVVISDCTSTMTNGTAPLKIQWIGNGGDSYAGDNTKSAYQFFIGPVTATNWTMTSNTRTWVNTVDSVQPAAHFGAVIKNVASWKKLTASEVAAMEDLVAFENCTWNGKQITALP